MAVIKEYQRKYTSEVEILATSTYTNINASLKGFLTAERVHKDISKEEQQLYSWIFEVLTMSPTIRKDELDSIIEGKKMHAVEVLATRVKEIQ
jgi:hypothetical protein